MNIPRFQKRVRDLAKSDEFNADLFQEISNQHTTLMKKDSDYLFSYEYLFLEQFILESKADRFLLTYFRNELLNTDPTPWKRSFKKKLKDFVRKFFGAN